MGGWGSLGPFLRSLDFARSVNGGGCRDPLVVRMAEDSPAMMVSFPESFFGFLAVFKGNDGSVS